MTKLIQLASATAVALAMGACATTDTADYEVVETTRPVTTTTTVTNTETLSDAQQIGVADNDGYMASGATGEKLDDKFKVDCNDNDGFVATGCESAMTTKTTTTMVKETTLVPKKTVLELVYDSPDHELLEAAIRASGLADEILDLDEGFTLFAPTDAAFIATDVSDLPDDIDADAFVRNHIIPGRIMSVDLLGLVPVTGIYAADTIGTRGIDFMRSGESVRLIGYDRVMIPITTADMVGTDGVVHVINTLLLPLEGYEDMVNGNS